MRSEKSHFLRGKINTQHSSPSITKSPLVMSPFVCPAAANSSRKKIPFTMTNLTLMCHFVLWMATVMAGKLLVFYIDSDVTYSRSSLPLPNRGGIKTKTEEWRVKFCRPCRQLIGQLWERTVCICGGWEGQVCVSFYFSLWLGRYFLSVYAIA